MKCKERVKMEIQLWRSILCPYELAVRELEVKFNHIIELLTNYCFIDSGDFHYLTEYWVSRIHEPFSLIVFDHHPDMQQPEWEGVVLQSGRDRPSPGLAVEGW